MIYINQRTKPNYDKKLHPHRQCFYASAVMFLSHYLPEAKSSSYYDEYVDDTEATVGKPGIAEKYFPRLSGRTGAFWQVHQKAIELRLPSHQVIFHEKISLAFLRACLASNDPIIYGTTNLGGLPGGHVVVAQKNFGNEGIITYDPFGDARTEYTTHDGEGVVYTEKFLSKNFSGRMIYAKKKA